ALAAERERAEPRALTSGRVLVRGIVEEATSGAGGDAAAAPVAEVTIEQMPMVVGTGWTEERRRYSARPFVLRIGESTRVRVAPVSDRLSIQSDLVGPSNMLGGR